uniref:Uncharacterized protein n=1 Tax=Paramormyrops kingsleyae TaxID=1676925 RepID=A0A3B3QM93_9TELE
MRHADKYGLGFNATPTSAAPLRLLEVPAELRKEPTGGACVGLNLPKNSLPVPGSAGKEKLPRRKKPCEEPDSKGTPTSRGWQRKSN